MTFYQVACYIKPCLLNFTLKMEIFKVVHVNLFDFFLIFHNFLFCLDMFLVVYMKLKYILLYMWHSNNWISFPTCAAQAEFFLCMYKEVINKLVLNYIVSHLWYYFIFIQCSSIIKLKWCNKIFFGVGNNSIPAIEMFLYHIVSIDCF